MSIWISASQNNKITFVNKKKENKAHTPGVQKYNASHGSVQLGVDFFEKKLFPAQQLNHKSKENRFTVKGQCTVGQWRESSEGQLTHCCLDTRNRKVCYILRVAVVAALRCLSVSLFVFLFFFETLNVCVMRLGCDVFSPYRPVLPGMTLMKM